MYEQDTHIHIIMQVSYKSPEELWKSVKGQEEKSWYKPAVEYWDQQPASYDGVLAGMPCCRQCLLMRTVILRC